MKNSFQITLKDLTLIPFSGVVKTTHDTFVKVADLIEGNTPLLIEVNHEKVTTVLELSKISPFVLLYFDGDYQFSGAAYSLNGSDSAFGVGTAFKKILLLPYPIDFKLENTLRLKVIE